MIGYKMGCLLIRVIHSKLCSITPKATKVHMINITEFCSVNMDA